MSLDWNNLKVHLNQYACSQWKAGVRKSDSWPRTMHDNDLWICNKGHGILRMDDEKIELRPGRIIWLRPGYLYDVMQEPDDPLCHYYLHFDLIRDGKKYFPAFDEFPAFIECFNYSHWYAMAGNMSQIQNFTAMSKMSEDVMEKTRDVTNSLLHAMLSGIDLCRSLTQPDFSVKNGNTATQAADYFSQNLGFFQPIEKTARKFGLSRSRFSKIFTDFWHVSPQKYQIHLRIERAKYLLSETRSPVSEIASSLGYTEPYFFSRQFKHITGMSPSEYRQGNKEEL